MRSKMILLTAVLAVTAFAIPAGADSGELQTFEVTLTNLSDSQPISPPVVATHDSGVRFWQRGAAASYGIVAIAEDGNPAVAFDALSALLGSGITDVVNVGQPLTRAGTTVGDFSDTVTFTIEAYPGDRLSLAGMLICTNDGFAGVDSIRLTRNGGEGYAGGYDAGSEINTERSEDIVDACSLLGPIALEGDDNGNENDAVDADGVITRHRGVVGESDLSSAHNWPTRILHISVTPMDS